MLSYKYYIQANCYRNKMMSNNDDAENATKQRTQNTHISTHYKHTHTHKLYLL